MPLPPVGKAQVFDRVGKPLPTSSNAGANPRELMARMGHDSPRAALIYMHSSDKRQRALADAVAKAARAELAQSRKATKPSRSGTRKAPRQDDA